MKRQRQMLFAVLGSVAVHLAFVLLAIFLISTGGIFPPPPAEASVPNEVILLLPEIIPEPAPEEEKSNKRSYASTSDTNRVQQAPPDAAFESDKSTTAASEAPASPDGDRPVPTQEGKDFPFMELENREYIDGEKMNENAGENSPASQLAMMTPPPVPVLPQPQTVPVPIEQSGEPEPEPKEMEIKEDSFSDDLDVIRELRLKLDEDLLKGKEKPTTEAVEGELNPREEPDVPMPETMPLEPQEPSPPSTPSVGDEGFRPHTRKTAIRGTISNRGSASVSAAETPLGKYKASVHEAIGKLWHRYRVDNAQFLVYGSIRVEFVVDRRGDPKHVRVVENNANAIMVDFTLSAILGADIPPMPEEILDILENESLEVHYDVIIY